MEKNSPEKNSPEESPKSFKNLKFIDVEVNHRSEEEESEGKMNLNTVREFLNQKIKGNP